jgi:hypothetical protein
MTTGQVTFAILAACLTVAGIAWAMISWRLTGSEVVAMIGQGEVDNTGILRVRFMSGESKITRLADPWDLRRRQEKQAVRRKGRKSKPATWDPTPVNAVFVRNRGRTAVTIQRCLYFADLEVTGFRFEPQPASSPWGDHLPKRLDPGEEAILVHEKIGMRVLWNKVMKDHGVAQTVYGVVLELGNGREVFADPPIVVRADMADEELATVEAQGVVERIAVDDLECAVERPRKRFKFFGKDQRQAIIMRDKT